MDVFEILLSLDTPSYVVYDASWLFLGFLALPTYIGIEEYNCMRNIKKGL